MRLRRIKLAGFKSFVDPITISMSTHLAGIVGPNGSGKSNIIDAVRWVSGESSARNLRGDTLDDVIFNGSESRKPSGQASVELVFENTSGKAPGVWAKYSEISVRRLLTRDGGSEYYINGTRTTRRDVTQLFLGTGFGARSYSIIEQGMISRIVEAKPEEIGGFIEEASGISRFREKRKETISKLRSTSDNLARLDDMRTEVKRHLNRLKSQSGAAKRFRNLKEKERGLQLQIMAHDWNSLKQSIAAIEIELSRMAVDKEQQNAGISAIQAKLEHARKEQLELQSALSGVELEQYRTDSEIAVAERRLEEVARARQEDEQAVNSLQRSNSELSATLGTQKENKRVADEHSKLYEKQFDSIAGNLEKLQDELSESEAKLAGSLERSEQIVQSLLESQRRQDAISQQIDAAYRERSRNESTISGLQSRPIDEESEIETSGKIDELKLSVVQSTQNCKWLEDELEQSELELARLRHCREQNLDELDTLRQDSQKTKVHLLSLERSIAEMDSMQSKQVSAWLQQRGLQGCPPLSSMMEVSEGWERAFDRVLANKITAVVVNDLNTIELDSSAGLSADMYLVSSGQVRCVSNERLTPLTQYVTCPNAMLDGWLFGIFAANSLDDAINARPDLKSGEVIVTPQGALIGSNWMSPELDKKLPAGVLELGKQLRELKLLVEAHEKHQERKRKEIESYRSRIEGMEQLSSDLRLRLNAQVQDRVDLQLKLTNATAQQDADNLQRIQTQNQISQLQSDNIKLETEAEQLRLELSQYEKKNTSLDLERIREVDECAKLKSSVAQLRKQVNQTVEQKHQYELKVMHWRSQRAVAESAIIDLKQRKDRLNSTLSEVKTRLAAKDQTPLLRQKLESLLDERRSMSDRLKESRRRMEDAEANYVAIDRNRLQHLVTLEEVNSKFNDKQLELKGLNVQIDVITQNITSQQADPQEQVELLGEEFDVQDVAERLQKVKRKIENTGSINLTAIEEYQQELVRKEYMDRQHDDLAEAVATLESSIAKIDRETRQQYLATFAAVNGHFQEMFPKLTGGGTARLELMGTYPENAGIKVIARPKGKRINNVQALSGGEKALTAVALVMSIFLLNPSPVCFLDEIDAPLDDENVHRLCENLRNLSDRTQMLLVTHNKITMEAVDMLIGVAMPEPNVSQMLSVSLEQAQEYAA